MLIPQTSGGTPRSVMDVSVESSDTEVLEPPGDMPLGVGMAVQAQPRVPHHGSFAVLAEDDTINAQTNHVSGTKAGETVGVGRWQVWT